MSGLKALVQFSAAQRLKSRQAVIQKHFAEMLAGMSRLGKDGYVCLLCSCSNSFNYLSLSSPGTSF